MLQLIAIYVMLLDVWRAKGAFFGASVEPGGVVHGDDMTVHCRALSEGVQHQADTPSHDIWLLRQDGEAPECSRIIRHAAP